MTSTDNSTGEAALDVVVRREGLRDLHQDHPEKLWQAITDPGLRAKHLFGTGVDPDRTPGSSYEAIDPAGLMIWPARNL